VVIEPATVGRLAAGLAGVLTEGELRDSRCLTLAEGTLPALADLMRMQSLQTFIGSVGGEWLRDVLQNSRLEAHFQPIVSARASRELFAYECLLRGRRADGALVMPYELFHTARRADLLFQLDLAARMAAIRGAVQHRLESHVFINFNPTAIYDPKYCLRATIEAIREGGIAPERVVFEVTESDEVRDPEHLLNIFEYYRKHGFRVALDDLGAGYASLNLLTRLRPDFVKLDMQLIRGVDHDPYKAEVARMLLTMAQNLGVNTVAEGIETEAEWHWFREHGADYVQGYFFARPGSPPPTNYVRS
jgi:EAL domain-containing protein (putative c-di-GMP-specific phosphodiesterase class I)